MLTWEINYWAMMDGDFDGYPADHDDSLIENALTVLSPCVDGSQTPPNSLHAELDEPGFSVPNGQKEWMEDSQTRAPQQYSMPWWCR